MRNKKKNVFIREDILLLEDFWKKSFNFELTDRLPKQS